MKRPFILLIFLATAGCNFVLGAPGEIAGSVTDISGGAVRGADVYLDGQAMTRTSPNGTFTLRNVTSGTRTVQVRLTIGSTNLRGTNKTVVYPNERTTSVSIVVAPVNQLGNMRGFAQDFLGNPLAGIRVFVAAPLGSWMTLTDDKGNYQIDDIVGGNTYTVTASGRGYQNDATNFNCVAGQTGIVNFTLNNSTNQNQNAVTNLTSIAWTSPVDPDRRPNHVSVYERIKRLYDRKRPTNIQSRPRSPGGRGPSTTQQIEVDLSWDYKYMSELLGYGIYKGTTPTFLQPYDLLRDPLAFFYADISDDFIAGLRYYYQVSRINTDYPASGSESVLSAITSAVPLDLLNLNSVTFAPLTFHWQGLSGADTYIVYLFSYYPDYQAVPIWTSSPTANTSVVYNGPPLTSGQQYWYVVLGSAFSDTSRTISQIDSFLAP